MPECTNGASVLLVVLCLCLPHMNGVKGSASVWGGVNSYFLHTLSASDRAAHLSAMQANGLKVVRIFITEVDAGIKGSSSTGVSALEPKTVGTYNDDVLNKIDVLMEEAVQAGVKLLIALHDRYSLGCRRRDAYVTKYNITDVSPICNLVVNQPRAFYVESNAQADFDRAIAHILTHRNPYFSNRPWGEINEAVFGFEPENEAQGYMNNPDWGWACRRAATMRKYVFNGIYIVTGGGVDFASSQVDNHFNCTNIDVVSIHDYSFGSSTFSSNLATAKGKALASGKRILMEEFGSTGTDAQKASVLSTLIDATAKSGVAWLPWEFVKPGTNAQDYEFWVGGKAWDVVACHGKYSLTLAGAFSWPQISSSGGSAATAACSSTGLKQHMEPPVPSPYSGPVALPGGETGATSSRRLAKAKIIGAVLGTTAASLMIVSFWHFWRRKGRHASDDAASAAADDDDEAFLGTLPGLLPRFSFKELQACTNDFSHKLGAGGFGTVFEGVNPRDKLKPVAVKRLEMGVSSQGSRQFQAEIATIGSIQHINLVRLHGFCMEDSHRMLVYELMSNGSLDAYIKKPEAAGSDHGPLPWRARFGIALGTARGLAYLHDECRERIIHCDIKPENILLNHRLEPAISDFGLAKLMSREQSYAATTMRGTRGYLAPEWVRNAPITEKSDVYSYGMVLLELVSGRRLLDAHAAISQRRYLPEWALSLDDNHDRGRAQLIDERLVIGTEEEVQGVEAAACQVIAIALLCIQEDPKARPSMAMVVKMLQADVEIPAFVPSRSINVPSNYISPPPSSNLLTISSLYPR